jgi:hypothetical protein
MREVLLAGTAVKETLFFGILDVSSAPGLVPGRLGKAESRWPSM